MDACIWAYQTVALFVNLGLCQYRGNPFAALLGDTKAVFVHASKITMGIGVLADQFASGTDISGPATTSNVRANWDGDDAAISCISPCGLNKY